MSSDTLHQAKPKKCLPCTGLTSAMEFDQIKQALAGLHTGWTLMVTPQHTIKRSFQFKGYRQAMMFANAAAWVADDQGHHPDMMITFNQVDVSFTTHDLDGLTENDFICASEIDRLFRA
jgi:4a-hydroxytetrahydrobiopterin dehydratase